MRPRASPRPSRLAATRPPQSGRIARRSPHVDGRLPGRRACRTRLASRRTHRPFERHDRTSRPMRPVVVLAADGRLANVRVTSTTGGRCRHAHAGADAVAVDRVARLRRDISGVRHWSTGSGTARAKLTSSFRTIAVVATVTASVFPSEGLSVGVGQPIVFRFDHHITDAAARSELLSHLDVTESTPVLGGWHWFSDNELHFRPKDYWPANEKITVAWDLRGWNAGEPGVGRRPRRRALLGRRRARVVREPRRQPLMTVTDNGRVVATYPISGGKASDPTMNGVHIVLDRSSVVRMNSATNGVPVNSPDGYDELVYWDVHISDSGEYVHAAPWSVGSQGVSERLARLHQPQRCQRAGVSSRSAASATSCSSVAARVRRRSAITASWTGTRRGATSRRPTRCCKSRRGLCSR